MTKHFPGGGPQKDGEDPHFPYGREQVYPGNNWDYHLIPFEAAFAAGTAQIMPYYGMPVGTSHEEVGFGFNQGIITGLLREHYGYDGIVCTDWGLINDANVAGKPLPARAWGVEHLSPIERVKKALDAGCDQFGGEDCPDLVIALVESGQVSEERIDSSARRLLREKFRLGLFDNPFVDPDAAQDLVGNDAFKAAGADAQRKSLVLLKNSAVLPLSGRPRVYVEGIDPAKLANDADVVDSVNSADFAILRIAAPFEPRDELFLETMFHAGSLAFPEEVLDRLLAITRTVPTIIDIYLDRPAVIPELAASCGAMNFGAAPEALLDVIFGRVAPTGRLPFELPSSMEAVRAQHPDVPYDSVNPVFPFGHGLTF
jgi:beta-glucosidase